MSTHRDPLAPDPFTPERVADLVRRVREADAAQHATTRCSHCGLSGHTKARGRAACNPTFMAAKLVAYGGESVTEAARVFGVNHVSVYKRAKGLRGNMRWR